jgi:hypothetical protein
VEKSQLINFIGKMMEDSGFKIYKNFKASEMIIDIYGVLPTLMGDFGVIVTCKNHEKELNVGIETLKDMEMVGRRLKASKIAIVTSSSFSSQAINYGTKKDIKLIDREDLIKFAKKFSEENNQTSIESIPSSNNDENQESNFNPRSASFRKTNRNPMPKKLKNDSNAKNKSRLSSIFSKSNLPPKNVTRDTLNNEPKKRKFKYGTILKAILNNIIIMIIVVVLLSYFIPYTLEKVGILPGRGITGIIKMLISLILSYGLVLLLNKNKIVLIIKGTIVFFISVAILIILILFYKP